MCRFNDVKWLFDVKILYIRHNLIFITNFLMLNSTALKIKISLVLIIVSIAFQSLSAQGYIDLFKINYTTVPSSGYEEVDGDNEVSMFDVGLTYPIKLSDKVAVITGLDYAQQTLELAPNTENVTLNMLRLKAGINIKHSDKVSGTYVLLPRISSEDFHTDGDHFFFGGLVLIKYQKTERFQWRFGAYASTEGFGVLATPIIGLHYKSENTKLEITANLPISADLNYTLGGKTSLGFGLFTPVRTFSMESRQGLSDTYTQVANIEFGPYFEYRILDNSLLLRAQAGYEALSYEVFAEGDELPFRLSAFEFGDGRDLLNPEMSGSLFFKIGAIYRFHLDKK